MSDTSRSGVRRAGCVGTGLLVVAGLAALVVIVAGTMSLVAWRQSRGMIDEPRRVHHAPPAGDRSGVLQLRLVSARLVLTPIEAGEPIGVEADYDPRYYALEQRQRELDDGRWLYRVRFAPSGNHVMAILRMKLGTALPTVRVRLPRDVAVEIDGDVRAGFAALELGGTDVRGVDVYVEGGAGTFSLLEPLARPLERFAVAGDKGSIEVTGLGHASPAETVIEHRLGELDVDLRGAWQRDGVIELDVSLGGGSVWLPDGVRLEGVPGRSEARLEAAETAAPRLRFDVRQGAGRLVFID